jgi:beta-N-acetylhexosaminidase
MAARAVTVTRNDNNTLPVELDENNKVLMLAPYNNERAQMVMGLNRAREAGLIPDSVRTRFYRFSSTDCEVKGELKNAIDWADVVIMSSELYNANDMAYNGWASIGPKNFTEYCKAKGKRSVVMSVNFPYDVQLYPDADAVVAVYGWKGSTIDLTSADVIQKLLYGEITEDKNASGPNIAAGVEVIFGVYGASGKLPVNVPAFDAKTKTYTDKIVYERGYGLTYDKQKPAKPDKAEIKSLKAGKSKLTVTMSAAPSKKGGTHYRIAYKVKGSSKWHYKTTKSAKLTISKLKSGKKYIVKARAYKTVDGKEYCGAWSKTKTSGKIK